MKKTTLLFSIILLFSTSAFARDWYADGGLGFVKFDDGADSVSPTNIYLRGGYQFNNYFNIGLESSFTVSPDQIPAAPNVDFSVTALTLYVRGGIPVSKKIWIYAQLGQTNTKLNAEFAGVERSEDNNDTMFGFGAEIYPFSEPIYIALNYSSYNDNGGVEVSAFNLGAGYRF